ncbi:MAG: tRNA (adenosine(37)-N6)-threonylcarbamoyltransferase complex transferase subunit TsaD [Anaerolineae bacterium]|nr:tRNA (adenosine(37)-N6)-threonylcarbamoyltransferase complex transferase subunit TsaD [Anaerolineae bacterium]
MTLILGIETSCDETAAAVVANGRHILSNIVASQMEIHRPYGGVFPELASRQHVLSIVPVIRDALSTADVSWDDIDAVAVVHGPGLTGSLVVGVNVAKALALSHDWPLIGINHLEAHIYANWLVEKQVFEEGGPEEGAPEEGGEKGNVESSPAVAQQEPDPPEFPLLCLVVSGGHTELVLMRDHGTYEVLGRTIDDAAGEAFDKVGRLLGLEYPGGPAIEKAAMEGDPSAYNFPRAWLKESYDFSFSGLKTAVLRKVQSFEKQQPGGPKRKLVTSIPQRIKRQLSIADLAASFQAAVVDVLVEKTARAAEEYKVQEVILAGGVAANASLRDAMKRRVSLPVRCPPTRWCTDNAAMVAATGYFHYLAGDRAGWDLDVIPSLLIG